MLSDNTITVEQLAGLGVARISAGGFPYMQAMQSLTSG